MVTGDKKVYFAAHAPIRYEDAERMLRNEGPYTVDATLDRLAEMCRQYSIKMCKKMELD